MVSITRDIGTTLIGINNDIYKMGNAEIEVNKDDTRYAVTLKTDNETKKLFTGDTDSVYAYLKGFWDCIDIM